MLAYHGTDELIYCRLTDTMILDESLELDRLIPLRCGNFITLEAVADCSDIYS